VSSTVVQPWSSTPERTGGTLGDRFLCDDLSSARLAVPEHTAFVLSGADNYVLRDVIPAWDEALPRQILDPALGLAWTFASPAAVLSGRTLVLDTQCLVARPAMWLLPGAADSENTNAYDAVRFVEKALGLPVRDVLKAAGIAHRTFYNWQSSGVRQPRLASEGRLWRLVQVTEDLYELLGQDLPTWIRASPDRRAILRKGKPDELLATVMLEQQRGPAIAQSVPRPSSALGPEPDLTRMAPRRIPRRGTAVRRTSSSARALDVPPPINED